MRGMVHVDVLLWCVTSVFLLLAIPELARDDFPDTPARPEVSGLEPAQVLRGMLVKVSGTGFDQATEIRVRLNEKELLLDKPHGDDARSLTFRIPPDFPLGQYTVRVLFFRNQQPFSIEGVPVPSQNNQLRVISDTVEKVKVTGVYPLVGYPVSGKFGFRILGEGFSMVPTDNQLVYTGGGTIDVAWRDVLPDKDKPVDKVYGRVVNTRQLEFLGIPQSEYQGRLNIQVRVGDSISDPVPVTFARVPKGVPWTVAIGVVALLAALVYIPVTWRLGCYKIGTRRYRPWSTFLLDQETDTLSLAKFQLYIWTGVAVFGYIYLTVARSLIQGVFEFAPIPEGLPGILAVSGGTAALSAGINNTRGPKGAGEEQPSFADLITTGGVVVAERFQFLVWTVLGALAFLFLVVFSDPATIQDLPKVPDGFLYLMGISSAGYLGGKLARKPGPVIDIIVAQQGSMVIDIQGRNLSRQAIFTIDEREVTYDLLPLPSNISSAQPQKDATLEVIRRDNDATQADFALTLRLTLTNEKAWLGEWRKAEPLLKPDDDWLKDTHQLCLMNPDGQKAVLSFTIKPKPTTSPAATPAATPTAGSTPTPAATPAATPTAGSTPTPAAAPASTPGSSPPAGPATDPGDQPL